MEKQGVMEAESSTAEPLEKNDVKEVADKTADQTSNGTSTGEENIESQPNAAQGQSAETEEASAEAFDDKGVPYKNRYYEADRKLKELSENIPSIIREELSKANQPKEQQYSIEELEQFRDSTENPQHKVWASSQIRKMEREQIASEFEKRISERETKREVELKKQEVFGEVQKNFPDLFVKDRGGNFVGWNNAHPMTREVANLMQDPRLKNDPDGLLVAAEIAHSRYTRLNPNKTGKVSQLKRENAKLKAQTMPEGDVQSAPNENRGELRKAIDNLKQTGSKTAATSAIRAYFKDKGLIKK